MADRMAIMLVLLKQRHGDDWDPWFGEGMWEDDGAMGDVIRGFSEYETAKKIIRIWIQKNDKREQENESA